MTDPLDQAIKAAEPAEQGRFTVTLHYANDRVGVIVLPSDLTSDEWVKTAAFLLGTTYPEMMKAQAEAAAEAMAGGGLLMPQRPKLVLPD